MEQEARNKGLNSRNIIKRKKKKKKEKSPAAANAVLSEYAGGQKKSPFKKGPEGHVIEPGENHVGHIIDRGQYEIGHTPHSDGPAAGRAARGAG